MALGIHILSAWGGDSGREGRPLLWEMALAAVVGQVLLNPLSAVDIEMVFILMGLLFPSAPVTQSCCHSPGEALQLREGSLGHPNFHEYIW